MNQVYGGTFLVLELLPTVYDGTFLVFHKSVGQSS